MGLLDFHGTNNNIICGLFKNTLAFGLQLMINPCQIINCMYSACLLSTCILRGKYPCTIDLLFDWFGISCMTTDSFCFYLQNRLFRTSQTRSNCYSDTSPFSIPWYTAISRAPLSAMLSYLWGDSGRALDCWSRDLGFEYSPPLFINISNNCKWRSKLRHHLLL